MCHGCEFACAVEDNAISPEGVRVLADALKANSTLQCVDLSCIWGACCAWLLVSWVYGWHEIPTVCCRSEFACAVEANVFDADGARALADAVTVNSTLQLLNLSGVFFLHFLLCCGVAFWLRRRGAVEMDP